jgi:restriction endonuclease Mrr
VVANDLPIESDVIAALKAFLDQQTRPIRPPEAYRALAEKFNLTQEQRTRLMPNSNEIHWENRVRQARRKLNNAGHLNRLVPDGKWAIKKPS